MIKVLEIVGKGRAFHNVIRDIHDKSRCSIAFNGEKIESVSLNPRTRQGFPLPHFFPIEFPMYLLKYEGRRMKLEV